MNKQQRDLLAEAMVSQTQMSQMCADFPDSKRQFDEMAEALRAAVALFDKLPVDDQGEAAKAAHRLANGPHDHDHLEDSR